jgi:hypothetical protein
LALVVSLLLLQLLPSLLSLWVFPEPLAGVTDAANMLLRWSLLREIWIRGVPTGFELLVVLLPGLDNSMTE